MATGKTTFDKPVINSKQILALLRQRGMVINDENLAYWALERIGFYRLTGYCPPFQNRAKQFSPNDFILGTTFEKVLALYNFDSELRGLIAHALGLLEVSLRTSICEKMCSEGSHWYTNIASYEAGKFQAVYEEAAKHVRFNLQTKQPFYQDPATINNFAKSLFLDHYYDKYNYPLLPPAWMLRESASFGFWARMYDALKSVDRKRITQLWLHLDGKKIDDVLFGRWLWSLTILRNRCSHHTRIINRSFPFQPPLPAQSPNKDLFESKTNDLRTLMAIILVLTKKALPQYDWRAKVLALFEAHENVDIQKATGFTKEDKATWAETKFWTHPSVH